MSDNTISSIRFQNYWNLLKLAAPQVEGVILFNEDGDVSWQSSAEPVQYLETLTNLVDAFKQHNEPSQQLVLNQEPESSLPLILFSLQDPAIEITLTVAFILVQGSSQQQLSVDNQSTIQLLNLSLLTEYSLIQNIAAQEQELNSIADELTHRYEELNLIYSSDNHVQNLTHGRELLQQILINASNFLDVDLVAIMLPGKNIHLHYTRQAQVNFSSRHILDALVKEIFPQLEKHKTTLVINHQEDARKSNLAEPLNCKFVVAPLLNAENEVIGLISIINQIESNDFTNSDRNLLEVLANKASATVIHNFDPLTGLENNHSFEMIVLDTLKQSWQSDSHHAIANIDIDRLAVINAISGLEAGDRLIKKIANTLTLMVRSCDIVARLGADKFAVLLKNCDLQQGEALMQKIALAVTEIDLELENEAHDYSISIGLAPITADIQTVSSVFNNVESARIAAKERGRNQIQVFKLDDSDLLRRKDQIKWVSRTQSAIRNNRFEIYAQRIQPIIPDQRLPHFEILLRMLDDDGKPVPPGFFLPAAENFFLMPKLDRWVINHTFELLSEFIQRAGKQVCEISINLSGQTLTDKDLAEYILKMLDRHAIDPRVICFEVTETAAVSNIKDAKLFISKIRERGCKFSLDDFGTGLSSFAYLQNLHVDYLKIDGAFVKNIVNEPVSLSMVSAINQVGHSMDLKTIAEFVENEAILNCLKGLGIDYAQGYAIHKPQPFAQELTQLMPQATGT